MARSSSDDNRQWYASRIDQQRRVQDPKDGGSDPDLYAKLQALADSAAPGRRHDTTLTYDEVKLLIGILGNRPGSDIGRILKRILDEDPTGTVITQVILADGRLANVNLRDYLQELALEDFNPVTHAFDPSRGGYDSEKGITEALTREEWHELTVADVSSVGRWPAPLTEIPTSTDDPNRPRTVAAGYDGRRKVLTVVFRDGTVYNYYGVGNTEWLRFLSTKSKGEVIKNYLDGKVRGPADTSGMPSGARQVLYKVARTSQEMSGGNAYGKGRSSYYRK